MQSYPNVHMNHSPSDVIGECVWRKTLMFQSIEVWLGVSCISRQVDLICVNVGICTRYQASPKKSHLTAVKRIIKYANGTLDYGIFYSKDTNDNLIGFVSPIMQEVLMIVKAPVDDVYFLERIWLCSFHYPI